MFYVYVISSLKKHYLYVGLTNNLQRRLKQHQNGKSPSTKSHRPFKLILVEPYESRKGARNREKYLKSGSGKEFLKSLIKPEWRNW